MPVPNIRTKLPGPNAARIIAEDAALISPSYTRAYPLVAKSGRGAVVEDPDGNQFLDFSAGIAVTATGHCHPQVVSAIQKQAAELIHMSGTDFYYDLMPQVAQHLSRIAPMPGPHKIYYGNSGAEAIECAIKLARYHTRRPHIIAFYGAFHGRTMGALSLTASKTYQRAHFAPLMPEVTHVPYPNVYRDGISPDRHEAYGIECARFIEQRVFRTKLDPSEVAAIVVEPLQGEGGYIVPPDSFLREIRAICNRHGILMVVDEIQSGMGRTGEWWAIQHSGVEPDIVTIAKGIASGMPLGAVISKAEVMDWTPGAHASTFGGNPVCLAAALATIQILEREAIANAATVGAHMLQRMREWPEKYPLVADVRGRGLMLGIEITAEKLHRTPAPEKRNALLQCAFERGLLILGTGESSIRLSPPLIVTQQEADTALDILQDCFSLQSGAVS